MLLPGVTGPLPSFCDDTASAAPTAASLQLARAIAAAGLACMRSETSDASENEAPAEAAHCAASNRSCCRTHAEGPRRAASDPSPGNLDSDTALSNRANTASFSSLKSGPNPLAENQNPPNARRTSREDAGIVREGYLCVKKNQYY